MKTKKLIVGVAMAAALAGLFTVVTPFRAAAVQVLAIVSCASASPCTGGSNTSFGSGVQGVSAHGHGVVGQTKNSTLSYASGVLGEDLSPSNQFNRGVTGTSSGGAGVFGESSTGVGVAGGSTNGTAVDAVSQHGIGVFGFSNGTAVYASSSSGNAIYAQTGGGVGAFITNSNGNGADIRGSYIGALARSNTFPLVASDIAGKDLFYINSNGDVSYRGTLNHFAAMRNRMVANAYVPNATTPTVEDSGTARLINGQAIVRLDNAFAQSIDSSQPYQVMLTPGGDTRGLFVATKTPGEFVVRENQAGHGTMNFDYHIYAHAFGHAKERMVLMSESAAASLLPRAKPPTPPASMSTHPRLQHTHL